MSAKMINLAVESNPDQEELLAQKFEYLTKLASLAVKHFRESPIHTVLFRVDFLRYGALLETSMPRGRGIKVIRV